MKKLISQMLERLLDGQRVVLCGILESDGSTPRGPGAKMAVFSDGGTLGTVGGGEVERLTALHALELLAAGRSETKRYLLHPNREDDLGMVCGGNVLMGFCCLCPDREADVAALRSLASLLDAPYSAWLKTAFFPDGSAALTVIDREDIHSEQARLPTVPTLTRSESAVTLLEPIARSETVYVFGGGHVGAALVPALAAVGFSVTVYDAREAFASAERFPLAQRTVCGPFEDLSDRVRIRPEDYVVVLTPGHRADYAVLAQVLRTEATYIGCIGSRKKVAYVNDRLREAGFTEEDVARIHAPIGLPILAQTPEEIAVSITAELIYHRRGGR